jgi:bifunctional non-homologous end joining protein LigD
MIQPMLSKSAENLPSGKNYIYEIKLDGQRTIAEAGKKSLLLYTRNFQNVTSKYPELTELKECLKARQAIFDGEIVALADGLPSFELLQQRMNVSDARALKAAVESVSILYYAFDIISLNGKSLLKTPLIERKEILNEILTPGEIVKVLPFFESKESTVQNAMTFGYEGVVAKKRDSHYCPGQRSDLWIKYKFQQFDSFVIGGWLEGGRSKNFGSLLIGKYNGKHLIYNGRVGTGFNDRTVGILMNYFGRISATDSPFRNLARGPKGVHWLKPKLVAEVKFKEWTRARILRAPVYMGLRSDLKPKDCILKS